MPDNEKYRRILAEETDISWVKDEAFIMREEGSGTRKEAEKQLKKAGIDVDNLNVVASIENSEAIKRSVKKGIGITIISKLAAQDDIDAGRVLVFPISKDGGRRNLNLVYNKNYQLIPAASKFVKVVKDLYLE